MVNLTVPVRIVENTVNDAGEGGRVELRTDDIPLLGSLVEARVWMNFYSDLPMLVWPLPRVSRESDIFTLHIMEENDNPRGLPARVILNDIGKGLAAGRVVLDSFFPRDMDRSGMTNLGVTLVFSAPDIMQEFPFTKEAMGQRLFHVYFEEMDIVMQENRVIPRRNSVHPRKHSDLIVGIPTSEEAKASAEEP